MNARRILALLLVLIPLGTLAFMSRALAFPAVIGPLAVLGAWGRFQWPLRRKQEMAFAALIAVIFGIKWTVLPPLRIGDAAFPFFSIGIVNYSLGYHIAQGILVFEVARFFVRQNGGQGLTARRAIMPLLCAVALIMAGTIPGPAMGGARDTIFQTASLAFAVITGVHFALTAPHRKGSLGRSERRSFLKPAFLCMMLVAVVAFGWASGRGMYKYGHKIDRVIGDVLQGRDLGMAAGFPTDGRFGKISNTKDAGGNATVLRAFCSRAPGYLRGKVYGSFEITRWTCAAQAESIGPAETERLPTPLPGSNWFSLREQQTARGHRNNQSDQSDPTDQSETSDLSGLSDEMEVHRALSLKQVLFTPLAAAYFGAPLQRLRLDVHQVAQSDEMPSGAPYQVTGAAPRTREPAEEERALLTALPKDFDPRLRELAAEITKNSSNDLEKTAAISQYLTANYEYDLGAGPADAKDPVCAFLFDVRKGHCEFFASSAAVLLRCAGVPCRYATGFVTSEQNAFGGYWVARNRDAHAWVEAYVEDEGWMIVEATPSSGVPAGQTSDFAQLWDYVQYVPKAILAALRKLGLKGFVLRLLRGIAAVLWGLPGILLILASGCAAVLWAVTRRLKRATGKTGKDDPFATAMQRLLRQMDARLAREQLVRARHETLHRFAIRVETAGQPQSAEWYRSYAVLRYGPNPDPENIEKLAQALQNR